MVNLYTQNVQTDKGGKIYTLPNTTIS